MTLKIEHTISTKEIQKLAYEILKDIDDYCKSENIGYMLSGGTCLGAVREKGFITWDDDADIMLNRDNYEKFLSGFSKKFENKYKVSSLYTDELWARPYAKIWNKKTKVIQKKSNEEDTGIGIDVFPVDNVPNSRFLTCIWIQSMKLFNIFRNSARRSGFYDNEKCRNVKKFMDKFTSKIGARSFSIILNKIASSFNCRECDRVAAILALNYWEKEIIEKKNLSKTENCLFEDRLFPIPIGYDEYLKHLYGDYMTPPNEEIDHNEVQEVEWNL